MTGVFPVVWQLPIQHFHIFLSFGSSGVYFCIVEDFPYGRFFIVGCVCFYFPLFCFRPLLFSVVPRWYGMGVCFLVWDVSHSFVVVFILLFGLCFIREVFAFFVMFLFGSPLAVFLFLSMVAIWGCFLLRFPLHVYWHVVLRSLVIGYPMFLGIFDISIPVSVYRTLCCFCMWFRFLGYPFL